MSKPFAIATALAAGIFFTAFAQALPDGRASVTNQAVTEQAASPPNGMREAWFAHAVDDILTGTPR